MGTGEVWRSVDGGWKRADGRTDEYLIKQERGKTQEAPIKGLIESLSCVSSKSTFHPMPIKIGSKSQSTIVLLPFYYYYYEASSKMAKPSESISTGKGGDGNVIILSRPSRSSGGGGRRGRRGKALAEMPSTSTSSTSSIDISAPAATGIVAGEEHIEEKSNTVPDASRSLDTLETSESSSASATAVHESADDILLGAPSTTSAEAAFASSSAPETSLSEPAVTIFSAPATRPGRWRRQHQQPRRSSLHKMPASRKKTVSFQTDEDGGCLCSFREIDAVSDMSPKEIAMVWYSEDDLDDMQEDVADVLEIIAGNATTRRSARSDDEGGDDVAVDDDDNYPDTRGLEGMRTAMERQDLQAARELNWDAVLDEQDRQWDVIDASGGVDEWGETFNGCQLMDPEKMGDIARKSSQKCVKIAQELGKADAEYVRAMVKLEAEAREAPKFAGNEKPVELCPPPLPGPPSNRLASRSVSSGEGGIGQVGLGAAGKRGGGIRTGAAGAALRQQRRTRQSFNAQPGLPSRPFNQPLRRVRSGGDVPDSLSNMVDALDSHSNDSDDPRIDSDGASRSHPNNYTGSRTENTSEKSTINSKTRNQRNNALQGLRSARQMERIGESRRVLAKGGSFRVAAPTSGDASPRRISSKTSTQTKQASMDAAATNKRKVRKGRLRKPTSRAENIKKLLSSSSGDANRNAKDTVSTSSQTSTSKGMTHLLKGKNKKTQANSSKHHGAYDFAPLAA